MTPTFDGTLRLETHPGGPPPWAMGYCPPCGLAWTASRVAHCATCHQTFASMDDFDDHRDGTYATGRTCTPKPATSLTPMASLAPAGPPDSRRAARRVPATAPAAK